MNRRQYLVYAGTGLGMSGALAGCLDTLSGEQSAGGAADDGSSSDEPTDDSSSDTDDRTVDREIRSAVGQFNLAGASVREAESGLDDPETAEYDPEEPREFLEEGLAHLEAAADAGPSDEQRADIDELHVYADTLGRLIDVTSAITDDTLEDDVQAINDAILEEDLETARTLVETKQDAFREQREHLDPALEAFDTLDSDRLDALSVADLEDVKEGALALDAVVSALVILTDALEEIVTGHEYLTQGQAFADDQAFADAQDAFENAKGAYTDAEATIEGGRQDAPDGLLEYFEVVQCQASNLERASELLAEGAEAAENNDLQTAEEREEEAQSYIDAAEACGS